MSADVETTYWGDLVDKMPEGALADLAEQIDEHVMSVWYLTQDVQPDWEGLVMLVGQTGEERVTSALRVVDQESFKTIVGMREMLGDLIALWQLYTRDFAMQGFWDAEQNIDDFCAWVARKHQESKTLDQQ